MCDHDKLKYVGHKGVTRVFCAVCGKELDKTFLDGKNSAKNTPIDPGMDKAPAKKTRTKKSRLTA